MLRPLVSRARRSPIGGHRWSRRTSSSVTSGAGVKPAESVADALNGDGANLLNLRLAVVGEFAADEERLTWRRFAEPPDRRDRVEVFARAYGLPASDGLVDALIARQHKFGATVIDDAEQGILLAVDEVAPGYLDMVDARIRWSECNHHLFE